MIGTYNDIQLLASFELTDSSRGEMVKPGIFFLVTVLHQFPRIFSTLCPDDVVTEVFSCLSNMTGMDGYKQVIVGGDVQVLQENCKNGGFSGVTMCVQRLFDNCHEERDVDVLSKLADTSAMRSAFSHVCLHLDVYASSSSCMRKQDDNIQSCIDGEYQRFHQGLTQITVIHAIITEYCRYIQGTSRCISQPIRQHCSEETAELLVYFMKGLTPPMCSAGETTTPLPLFTLSILSFFSILFSVSLFITQCCYT